MEEIKLTARELTKLDNEGFEHLTLSGSVTKEDIIALSQTEKNKLKQVLSTNQEIGKLLEEVKSSGAAPEEKPKESEKQSKKPFSPERLRSEGFTDLYVIARALELGYMPSIHTMKITDKGSFLSLKDNWFWNKAKYFGEGGPITNGTLAKSSKLNVWANDKVKDLVAADIKLEKKEVREILARATGMSSLDSAALNGHFNILNDIEGAINSGNDAAIKSAFKKYKENFSTEKANSFLGFTKKYRVNLISTGVSKEARSLAANTTMPLSHKEARLAELKGIEDELAKQSPDFVKIKQMKDKYELSHRVKLGIGNKNTEAKKALLSEKTNVEGIKAEVIEIDKKIKALQKQALDKTSELNKMVPGITSERAKALKGEGTKIIEDINKEIIELEKRGVNSMSKLDISDIKLLSSSSPRLKALAEFNGWIDDKVMTTTTGKFLIGASVFTMVLDSGSALKEIWHHGLSQENFKDMIDLGIGAIPVVGGMHDLRIAASGKDFNNRKLSTKERVMRGGFGTIGVLPGVGLAAKTGRFLPGAAGKNVVNAVDIAMETGKIVGKVGVYSYLGYSLYTGLKKLYYEAPVIGDCHKGVKVK